MTSELVKEGRLTAAGLCAVEMQATATVVEALADRIEALERENAELRDELKHCRKEKTDLVLKAYPAMDQRDAFQAALRLIAGQGQNNPEDPTHSEHLRKVLIQIAESAIAKAAENAPSGV